MSNTKKAAELNSKWVSSGQHSSVNNWRTCTTALLWILQPDNKQPLISSVQVYGMEWEFPRFQPIWHPSLKDLHVFAPFTAARAYFTLRPFHNRARLFPSRPLQPLVSIQLAWDINPPRWTSCLLLLTELCYCWVQLIWFWSVCTLALHNSMNKKKKPKQSYAETP